MAKSKVDIDAFVATVMSAPAHTTHGLTVVAIGDGEATLEFEAGPAALAPHGGVHGGVLAMLMEPAAVCALFPMLPADRYAVTADMHLQHMRPVRPNVRVKIVARVLRVGASLAFCEASVIDDGKTCTTARLTKAIVLAT
jgi:uncharacterized protein (TIGR00369 family)